MRDPRARYTPSSHIPLSLCAVRVATEHHYGTNPNSGTNLLFAYEKLISFRFSVYRIREAPPRNGWRRRLSRERGLNENIFMVLVLVPQRKARSGGFLHSRPCTTETPSGCPIPRRKSPGPIVAPAASIRQPAPCPNAGWHPVQQLPPAPHSPAPASTDPQDARS